MDSSIVVKPRSALHSAHAPRDPVPVRHASETQLGSSKTVAAIPDGERSGERGKQDQHERHQDSRSDHAAYEVTVDPENRDRLYRERDVRAPEAEHPDQALLRQRAYGHAASEPAPAAPAAGSEAHADLEA